MNNIFKFATTELSQDAFICWCINFFNYDCNLKKLSIDLLKKFNIGREHCRSCGGPENRRTFVLYYDLFERDDYRDFD